MELFAVLGIVGIATVMATAALSFNSQTKKDEYRELVKSSANKFNLNLFPLLLGFARKKDDPLRPSHIKLAKVGLVHFGLMLLGILCVFIIGALVSIGTKS